ncbi:transaldolase [Occultella aeris]|uniref:Transaldolase n=1 Tax=Occultella aeris TaxID=2761496 RepID=A0A7M4DRQ5_9MICO|nr:transaldolase [Occultella aeris]VZO40149.1 Transaldolase [Occultella aeris]
MTQPSATTANALTAISEAGVSVWLDDLSREALTSGALQNLIDTRSVVGVTTNPTIFAKAIAEGNAYDTQLRELAASGTALDDAVLTLTTDDVRNACDLFAGIHAATGGQDGRVSIEVDPRLARETQATIASAHTLWDTVDRPNLFVKIPATVEGLPAITAAIADGISVNVTLVFSLDRFRAVAQAYIDGLELAHQAGKDLSAIRSVSSLFLSRIDTQVDKALAEIGTEEALALRGKAAIANARLAYEVYEEVFATPRYEALAAAGAHTQRPLWASTGTKDPAYPDTMYVDELVVADVVNTMPAKTLEAVADHSPADGTDTVHGTFEESRQILDTIERLGVPYGKILEGLEDSGVDSFEKSWAELLGDVTDGLAAAGS